jgi:hypothetical protein
MASQSLPLDLGRLVLKDLEENLPQQIHSTLDMWHPALLQKLYSTRKFPVQLLLELLLRQLRLLGRLLLLNITVFVLILMRTVRTLIEEALSKGFKGCG